MKGGSRWLESPEAGAGDSAEESVAVQAEWSTPLLMAIKIFDGNENRLGCTTSVLRSYQRFELGNRVDVACMLGTVSTVDECSGKADR